MLSAVRRAPGSLKRVLSSRSTAASIAIARRLTHSTSISTRYTPQVAGAARQLHSTPRWQRDAYAAASIDYDAPAEPQDRNNALSRSNPKDGPITSFQELANQKLVDANLIRPITDDMKITTMTHVQSLTINETLKGVDV